MRRSGQAAGQLELDFDPPLPQLGHAGLGTCDSYRPDDPKLIDQAPYREFVAKKGSAPK